jgi:membrane-bound serine protease (ClpP class)
MAGHIAAMAPSTRIGAAHPVGSGGEDIEGHLGDKVTNDAAALAKSIARQRGRNEQWAEYAVRKSVSAFQDEAVELHVVDLVADDLRRY